MTPPAGSRKPSDGLKRSGHGPTKRRLKVERLEQDRREALALVEQSAALLAVERGKADGLRDRLVGAQAEQALAQRAATETRRRGAAAGGRGPEGEGALGAS